MKLLLFKVATFGSELATFEFEVATFGFEWVSKSIPLT